MLLNLVVMHEVLLVASNASVDLPILPTPYRRIVVLGRVSQKPLVVRLNG